MSRSVIGHAAIHQMEIEHLRRCREREPRADEIRAESSAERSVLLTLERLVREIKASVEPLTRPFPGRRGAARIR